MKIQTTDHSFRFTRTLWNILPALYFTSISSFQFFTHNLPSHFSSLLGPFLDFFMVNLLFLSVSLLPLPLPPLLFPRDGILYLLQHKALKLWAYLSVSITRMEFSWDRKFCIIHICIFRVHVNDWPVSGAP